MVRLRDRPRKLSMLVKEERPPYPLRWSRSYEDILIPGTGSSNSESPSGSKAWTPLANHRNLGLRRSLRSAKYSFPTGLFSERSGRKSEAHASNHQSVSPPSSASPPSEEPSSGEKRSTLPNSFRASFSDPSGPRATSSNWHRLQSENQLELPPPAATVGLPPLSDKPARKAVSSPSLKWKRERGHAKSQSVGNK